MCALGSISGESPLRENNLARWEPAYVRRLPGGEFLFFFSENLVARRVPIMRSLLYSVRIGNSFMGSSSFLEGRYLLFILC